MAAQIPYPGIPANAPVRIIEEGSIPSTTTQPAAEPTQPTPPPHPQHPHHFSFPRLSLHNITLKSHHHSRANTSTTSQSPAPATSAVWSPPTDIRETHHYYHIEIEVPGVVDKDDLLIQWMSPHTLLVQGESIRPRDIGSLATQEGSRVWEGENSGWPEEVGRGKSTKDGAPLVRTPSRETMEAELLADTTPSIVLAERKLGAWRRTFTLPEDVEMKELRARLDRGLLRIDLPKRVPNGTEHGGVRIQVE